ncbi:MAG: hypothetical protein ACXAD7_27825, partial [Candidatus Kariarchaeaceae archaeon]
ILKQFHNEKIFRNSQETNLFDSLDIFQKIENKINDDSELELITKTLREWDKTTYDKIWSLLRSTRRNAFYSYIFYNKKIDQKTKAPLNEDLFFKYGNAIYLSLLGIKQIYPEIDGKSIIHIWKHHFPWVLKIIGFEDNYPSSINTAVSTFQPKLFWIHIKTKAQYWTNNSVIDSKQVEQFLNIRHGFLYHLDRYTWFILDNFKTQKQDVCFLETSSHFFLGPSIRPFKAISDNQRLRDYTGLNDPTKSYQIFVGNYHGDDYLWYWTDQWNLIGIIKINYHEHGNQIKNIEMQNAIFPCQIDIEPEGIDREVVPSFVEENQVIKVHAKIGYDTEFSEFYIDYFNNDEDDEKPVWTSYYELIPDLVNQLKSTRFNLLTNETEESEDNAYLLKPYYDIDYNGFDILKAYVNTSKFTILSEDPNFKIRAIDFYEHYYENDDEDPSIAGHRTVSVDHDYENCPIKDISFDEIKQSRIMPRYRMTWLQRRRYPPEHEHGRCWKLTINDKNLQKQIFDKKLFNPHEIRFHTQKGVIEDPDTGTNYTIEFEFNRVEYISGKEEIDRVFQEDSTMCWIIQDLTGLILPQLDPNTHKEDEEWDLISITQITNSCTITLQSSASGEYHPHLIIGSNDYCIKQRRYKMGLESFKEETIFDFLSEHDKENYDELSKPYLDESIEHISECEDCQYALEEDADPLMDLKGFYVDDMQIRMVGIQIIPPTEIDTVISVSWRYSPAEDYFELLDDTMTVAYEMISDKRLEFELFGYDVKQTIDNITQYYADPIDSILSKLNNSIPAKKLIELTWLIKRLW